MPIGRGENGRVPPLSLKEKIALYLMFVLTVCVAFSGRLATQLFELIYPDLLGVDAQLPIATNWALFFGRYTLVVPVLLVLLYLGSLLSKNPRWRDRAWFLVMFTGTAYLCIMAMGFVAFLLPLRKLIPVLTFP